MIEFSLRRHDSNFNTSTPDVTKDAGISSLSFQSVKCSECRQMSWADGEVGGYEIDRSQASSQTENQNI